MHPDTGATDASTHLKRPPSPVAEGPVVKKPQERSTERKAADFLADNNRIGSFNHQPYKKRRYATLKTKAMLNGLEFIYLQFFKAYWNEFSRVFEKAYSAKSSASRLQQHATRIYLTHWFIDCYVSIRSSLKQVDPIAFNEHYHHEVAPSSFEYDHFLAMLCNCLRPVHLGNNLADELYIPILQRNQDFSATPKFDWGEKYEYDISLFNSILDTIRKKNLLKLSLITTDVIGRPFWLFDWPTESEAYAWFPEEGNYDAVDITMAYIIGCGITSKLGIVLYDEWKYIQEPRVTPTSIPYDGYQRVNRPLRFGTSSHHFIQHEIVVLPNFYHTGTEANMTMTGPISLPGDASSSTAASATDSERLPDDSDTPTSPAPAGTIEVASGIKKALRTRAVDCLYHTQVIQRMDTTTRFTAWKVFTKP